MGSKDKRQMEISCYQFPKNNLIFKIFFLPLAHSSQSLELATLLCYLVHLLTLHTH